MTRRAAVAEFKRQFAVVYFTPGHLYDSQYWFFIMFGWLIANGFNPDEASDIAYDLFGDGGQDVKWFPKQPRTKEQAKR
jgi:hypothetical protein